MKPHNKQRNAYDPNQTSTGRCKLPTLAIKPTYLSAVSRNNQMAEKTYLKHYAIEGGKERILKVKPKGGEWCNEFHRIFIIVNKKALDYK